MKSYKAETGKDYGKIHIGLKPAWYSSMSAKFPLGDLLYSNNRYIQAFMQKKMPRKMISSQIVSVLCKLNSCYSKPFHLENAGYGRGQDNSLRFNGQQAPDEDEYSYAYNNAAPFVKTNKQDMENYTNNDHGK